MSYSPLTQPWEEFPVSFSFPYHLVWSNDPNKIGYVIVYILPYGSFAPVNEQCVFGMIPFRTTVKGCRGPIS